MSRVGRSSLIGLAALAALVMASATVDAQPPGGRGRGGRGFGMMGGFGGGGVVGLLQRPEVRKELSLSDEQLGALTRLRDEISQQAPGRGGGQRPNFREMSDQERQAFFERMQKEREARMKEIEKKVAEILTKEQFKRLKQIELQQQGVRALLREDIIQALGITAEQQEKLRGVAESVNEERRGMFQNMDFRNMTDEQRQGLRDKMQGLQKKLQSESMAVLTDEQKTKLKDIMGEPFELQPRAFGGFRGRGGQPGAQGRGRGGQGRGGRGRPQA